MLVGVIGEEEFIPAKQEEQTRRNILDHVQ
jgi:hypothetical protein